MDSRIEEDFRVVEPDSVGVFADAERAQFLLRPEIVRPEAELERSAREFCLEHAPPVRASLLEKEDVEPVVDPVRFVPQRFVLLHAGGNVVVGAAAADLPPVRRRAELEA